MKKFLIILSLFLVFSGPVYATANDVGGDQNTVTTTDDVHRPRGVDDLTTPVGTPNNAEIEPSSEVEYTNTTVYNNDFSSNCIDFSPAMRVIGYLVLILKIIIPIIIIAMASINMYSTVTNGKSDDFSKVIKKLAFSILGGVLIFLAPVLVDFVMNAVTRIAQKPTEYSDIEACRMCIFHPTSEECSNFIELSKSMSYGEEVLISKTRTTQPATNPRDNQVNLRGVVTLGEGFWIAHQKNTEKQLKEALEKDYFGIEVDVSFINGEFWLRHGTEGAFDKKLDSFLVDIRDSKKLAVLDIKSIGGRYSDLVRIVKENYSLDSVIFMADSQDKINAIYNVDNSARLWYINGFLPGKYPKDETFDKDNMSDAFINKLEGVAVLALLVDKELVDWVHSKGLIIEAFSYVDAIYPTFTYPDGTTVHISTKELRDWGVDYLSANQIYEN